MEESDSNATMIVVVDYEHWSACLVDTRLWHKVVSVRMSSRPLHVSVSPDHHHITVATRDVGTLFLNRRSLQTADMLKDACSSTVQYSHDGRYLAAFSPLTRAVSLYECRGGAYSPPSARFSLQSTLALGPGLNVNAIRFTPNNEHVAVGVSDGSVAIYRVPELTVQHIMTHHDNDISDVLVISNTTIVSSCEDAVWVSDIETGAKITKLNEIGACALAQSATGTQFACGALAWVRVYDAATLDCVATFHYEGGVRQLAYLDLRSLIAVNSSGNFVTFDLETNSISAHRVPAVSPSRFAVLSPVRGMYSHGLSFPS